MHPHVVDPQLCALPHGGICCLGFGPNHYGFDTAGDRLQVGIGAVPFDGLGIRVDGEDFIASVPQTLVHDGAAVSLRVPGNSCHRNPFVGEEVGGGLLDGFHEDHHTDCATIRDATKGVAMFWHGRQMYRRLSEEVCAAGVGVGGADPSVVTENDLAALPASGVRYGRSTTRR